MIGGCQHPYSQEHTLGQVCLRSDITDENLKVRLLESFYCIRSIWSYWRWYRNAFNKPHICLFLSNEYNISNVATKLQLMGDIEGILREQIGVKFTGKYWMLSLATAVSCNCCLLQLLSLATVVPWNCCLLQTVVFCTCCLLQLLSLANVVSCTCCLVQIVPDIAAVAYTTILKYTY